MKATLTQQASALAKTAGVRVREDLVLVRIAGDDRRSWLNGQITNDVRALGPGDGLYALAVNVRGKVLADLWVLDRGEHLAVLLPRAASEAVLESFERQIIMEDVALSPVPELRCISVQGARAGDVVAAGAAQRESHRVDELGHDGRFVLIDEDGLADALAALIARAEELGGCAVDDAGFELARLRAGRPRFGRDFWDQHYPQEAGLKDRAVSFNKGCYLGQEVVCTLENRGKLTRALVRLLVIDGPEPAAGAELHDGQGKSVGQLTSVAADPELGRTLALGYTKRAHSSAGSELRAGETRLLVQGAVGGA